MIINIMVKPKSSKENIAKRDDGTFTVFVKEKAEDSKANIAVIRALARYFNVSTSQINIKSGFKSRKKIIEIVK